MEKLQISEQKAQRTIRHRGGEVLLIRYPLITGETAAAAHTRALIDTLLQYAADTVATRAKAALSHAVAAGRLFDFTRGVFEIEVKKAEARPHLTVALTVKETVTADESFTHTLLTHWECEEGLQVRAPKRKRQRQSEQKTLF